MMFNVRPFNVFQKSAENRGFRRSGLLIWNQNTAKFRSVFAALFLPSRPPCRLAVGLVVFRSRIRPDFRFQILAEIFLKFCRATGEGVVLRVAEKRPFGERAGGGV